MAAACISSQIAAVGSVGALLNKTSCTTSKQAPLAAFRTSEFSRSALTVQKSKRSQRPSVVRAADIAEDNLTGVIFEPFQEVQDQLIKVTQESHKSLARQRYAPACEAAINEQINVEYNMSYIYHALYAYFDRDNVGLPGLATFFKNSSADERHHAEELMKYQNTRGGRVKLQSILFPQSMEFDHPEKGDALYAMELALSMEKLTNDKLLALHAVADENDDPQMADFIESNYLQDQVDDIKKVSEYVSQLRRVGKGHGVFHFDRQLQEELNGEAA
eukprot:jgi/Mesen1/2843/ME000174S02095